MPGTILVVDDSASMRQLISMTLKAAGYQTVEACDGQDALKKAQQEKVQMVLTDLNMPGLNGLGLIRELRQLAQYRYTPIIMLTTESQEKSKQEGKQAGATGWLVKPFQPEQLVTIVKKVLP